MKNNHKLERAEIRPAENGFTVQCWYKQPETKPGKNCAEGMSPAYMEPSNHVFKTAKEMLAFIGEKV